MMALNAESEVRGALCKSCRISAGPQFHLEGAASDHARSEDLRLAVTSDLQQTNENYHLSEIRPQARRGAGALSPAIMVGWPRRPSVRPPRVASITRCDLGQIFQLNLDDREYTSRPIPKPLSAEEQKARAEELKARAAQGPRLQRPARPNLLVEITTSDTGERKQMFGYTARHVVTTEKRTPLEGAVSLPQEQITDGWYVDLDTSISCDPPRQPGAFAMLSVGQGWKNGLSHV